jgi:hypothetical protein
VRDVRLHVLFETQTMLDCQDGSVRAVRDPQFRDDLPHVLLDCAHADKEMLSDLFVGMTLS